MKIPYVKFPLVLAAAALMIASADRSASAGEIVSDWAEGLSNKARLIAGKASGGAAGHAAQTFVALQINMDPGFKTYWRNPGEAGGVPPEFDFEGSKNLANTNVLYPAPHRTRDKAGENIAYKDSVSFPIIVAAQDPAKPVELKLKATYGVCKDICIPAEAELELTIPPDVGTSSTLSEILATVPSEASDPSLPVRPDFGLHGGTADRSKDPVLSSWRLERAGSKAKLVLEVSGPAGGDGDAFLFSSDGLYMPMTTKVSKEPKPVYEAELTEGASLKELAGKTISVTLTGAKGQSETFIQLPKDLASP